MRGHDRMTSMAANGPPPKEAATLYPGEVMHQRLRPFGHRFTYRVFSLVIDLGRLDEADRQSRLFSVNRGNIVSFHEADHALQPGERLFPMVTRLLREAGLREPPAKILLMCYPRLLGFVFNPISVFFAYDRSDSLVGVVYSVRNTFGERHLYVTPVLPGEVSDAGLRQEREKRLHVSPFIGMEARYHFRLLPPGHGVRLRIHETEAGEPLLAATFVGEARPLRDATLAAQLARLPLMTFKVVAAIHWQALKIWWKGATFHKSPPVDATISQDRRTAALEAGE